MISFSSSLQDGGMIATDEVAVFTCRASGQSLQWTYGRNEIDTRVVASHSTQNEPCKDREPFLDIEAVEIYSLLAANNNDSSTGDITSVLEVRHKMTFPGVTIRCEAIEGQDMVVKTFIYDIKGKLCSYWSST